MLDAKEPGQKEAIEQAMIDEHVDLIAKMPTSEFAVQLQRMERSWGSGQKSDNYELLQLQARMLAAGLKRIRQRLELEGGQMGSQATDLITQADTLFRSIDRVGKLVNCSSFMELQSTVRAQREEIAAKFEKDQAEGNLALTAENVEKVIKRFSTQHSLFGRQWNTCSDKSMKPENNTGIRFVDQNPLFVLQSSPGFRAALPVGAPIALDRILSLSTEMCQAEMYIQRIVVGAISVEHLVAGLEANPLYAQFRLPMPGGEHATLAAVAGYVKGANEYLRKFLNPTSEALKHQMEIAATALPEGIIRQKFREFWKIEVAKLSQPEAKRRPAQAAEVNSEAQKLLQLVKSSQDIPDIATLIIKLQQEGLQKIEKAVAQLALSAVPISREDITSIENYFKNLIRWSSVLDTTPATFQLLLIKRLARHAAEEPPVRNFESRLSRTSADKRPNPLSLAVSSVATTFNSLINRFSAAPPSKDQVIGERMGNEFGKVRTLKANFRYEHNTQLVVGSGSKDNIRVVHPSIPQNTGIIRCDNVGRLSFTPADTANPIILINEAGNKTRLTSGKEVRLDGKKMRLILADSGASVLEMEIELGRDSFSVTYPQAIKN